MASSNKELTKARNAARDEFYTRYEDIEKEMNAYPDAFRDKTVLLPCDDPSSSEFTRYFAANFTRLGLKKLISTSYAKGAKNRQPDLFEINSSNYDPKKHDSRGKLFVITRNASNSEAKIDEDSIRFQGYLEGDGDFRSREVCALRDEADIIVTNPPFSQFRDFLAWILEAEKKFIILGNINAVTYKEVFPYLRNNQIWLGNSIHSGDRLFYVPDDYPLLAANCGIDSKGKQFVRVKGVRWFTNLSHSGRHQPLQLDTMENNLRYNKTLIKELSKKYGMSTYPRYDNYDAIEVPFSSAIPSDWEGVMGVPITFLDKYDPDQFDIVSLRKGDNGENLVLTPEREREINCRILSMHDSDPRDDQECRRKDKWQAYLRSNNNYPQKMPIDVIYPLSTNLQNGLVNDCTILGKKTYVRMLIRKKEK